MKQFHRIFAVILCLTMVLAMTGCKANDYKAAVESLAAGNYAEAGTAFKALGDYKDSAEQAKECDYQLAMESFIGLDYTAAKTAFEALGDYKDSKDLLAQASDALIAAELVGTWTCEQDILEEFLDGLSTTMDEELLGYFKADSLIVKQELVFGEDASFTMSCTEESKTGYVSDIKKMVTDGLNQYFADLMAETAKEEGITVEDVMKAYEVDSLEGVFKAQMGMTVAEFVNQLLPQETLESLIDATSASGTYEVKDGSLSLAMDGVYVTAVYDAEAGTVTMDADGSVYTRN